MAMLYKECCIRKTSKRRIVVGIYSTCLRCDFPLGTFVWKVSQILLLEPANLHCEKFKMNVEVDSLLGEKVTLVDQKVEKGLEFFF